jgi:hypothetical protein
MRGWAWHRLDLLERFVQPLDFLALDVEEVGVQPEDVTPT